MSETGLLRCPVCGEKNSAQMADDACLYLWECPACQAVVKPKPGDCCVFCSYGAEICLPKRVGLS